MAKVVVELKDGIKVGAVTHKRIQLKTLTVGETLECTEAAEKVVITPTGYELVTSKAKLMFSLVVKQASLVDDPDLKLTETLMRGLSGSDFDLLMESSRTLEDAEARALEIEHGGRS